MKFWAHDSWTILLAYPVPTALPTPLYPWVISRASLNQWSETARVIYVIGDRSAAACHLHGLQRACIVQRTDLRPLEYNYEGPIVPFVIVLRTIWKCSVFCPTDIPKFFNFCLIMGVLFDSNGISFFHEAQSFMNLLCGSFPFKLKRYSVSVRAKCNSITV